MHTGVLSKGEDWLKEPTAPDGVKRLGEVAVGGEAELDEYAGPRAELLTYLSKLSPTDVNDATTMLHRVLFDPMVVLSAIQTQEDSGGIKLPKISLLEDVFQRYPMAVGYCVILTTHANYNSLKNERINELRRKAVDFRTADVLIDAVLDMIRRHGGATVYGENPNDLGEDMAVLFQQHLREVYENRRAPMNSRQTV